MIGANAEENTTLVATLSHGNSLTAYYGKNALYAAYNAAKDGDIITLSAGTFTSVAMSKNITIRGVGGWADASSDNVITCIDGVANYKLEDNDYELRIEGVKYLCRVTVENSLNVTKECTFSKVNFSIDNYGYSFDLPEKVFAKLDNCVTVGRLSVYGGACTNCVFNGVHSHKPSQGSTPLTLQNCVIRDYSTGNNWDYNVSTFKEDFITNCIFIFSYDGTYNKSPLDESNTVHNCVVFNTKNNGIDIFQNISNSSNKTVTDRDKFFKNSELLSKTTDKYGDVTEYYVKFDNLTKDGKGLFELSDEAKEIYKGNDGTVVGVWGGATPFNMTPSNPRITKCEIVPKVNAEGKLSVTIEVAQ